MRPLQLTVLLACSGCTVESDTRTQASKPEILIPDHTLRAFDGQLLGTDRGEWIGQLIFQDATGNLNPLLKENVHGIIENSAGVFVFTGLAHLGINEGYIYVVTLGPNEQVEASLLGRLPGAPAQLAQQPDGSTTFLVYAGYKGNRQVYECYSLTGKIVSHSNGCLPPKRLSSNNLFKPNLLRGST